jgi:hypothetical protein
MCSGDLQDSCVSMTELLSPLFHRAGAIEKHAAARKQLLAFAAQEKPAPDPIEESQAELVLEIHDLPRQGGLRDAKPQRCLGDGTELGHGHEGTGMPQVHSPL